MRDQVQKLGITESLPEEAWRQQPREISDELVALLGAGLAAVRVQPRYV